MNGASAGKKIITLLNTPDPVWGEKEVKGNELKLENIDFSYDGKRDVLKNVSAKRNCYRRRRKTRKRFERKLLFSSFGGQLQHISL